MHEASSWDTEQLRRLARRCDYSSRKFARELGFSPRHLRRQMRLRFGASTRAWLKEQRLLTAADDLRKIRVVKVVASAFGFPSVAQFSRDFRLYFHVTPRAFLQARG